MLLLDTNMALPLVRGEAPPLLASALATRALLYVSTASIWEIAIKSRLGKPHVGVPLELLPRALADCGCRILPVSEAQVEGYGSLPPTRSCAGTRLRTGLRLDP